MRIPCRLSTAWGRRPPLWNYGSSVDHWYTFSVSATARQRYSTHNGDSISWSRHQFPKSSSSHEITENLPVARNGANKSTAYIALGSNLGDRIGMIEKACNEMSKRGIKIKRTSSLWETEPMYVLEQEKFINGACEIETSLEPIALLDVLQSIERDMGREKVIDKGPRNIDLDILLYDNRVVDHERLQIPHPGLFEREFVLRPLAELIPSTALDFRKPWKLTQDFLNALPRSAPLSTVTPLGPSMEPLRPLKVDRNTHVMGILNLSPESFSDGKVQNSTLDNIQKYTTAGVSLYDVGGQSSAPGASDISADEELDRILPVIKSLNTLKERGSFAISVDTYRAEVARGAVEAGADIINDISAGHLDPDMLTTMAELGKTVCLMHMRGTPASMNDLTDYPDGLIPTIASELIRRIAAAEEAGIRRWRIILDPGIGFAKTSEGNVEILRRLDELREWPGLVGMPWLVGSSRKRFVGKLTGIVEPHLRDWGTAATVAAAIQGGADIVRVHRMYNMLDVAKMSDAIWRDRK